MSDTKYRFNKEKHLHEIFVGEKWQSLTGCTTILSVLAKPALIQWAADMVVGQFGWIKDKEWKEEDGKLKKIEIPKELRLKKAEEGLVELSKLKLEEFLKKLDEARIAHIKRKEESGDYGTKIHELISNLIGLAIKKNKGFIPESIIDLSRLDCGIDKSFKNFIDWASKNKVKFLESERNIYSEKLFIGGIVDMLCEIDGQVWLGDIKTSGSGIYPDHFFQCAGYHIMLEDMGLYPKITGYLILNLKESGEMLEKRSISNEENRKIFINCLEIYRQQEKLTNNIIK